MDITSAKERYNCVIDVCRTMEPASIIEIGVHKGARARRFVHDCLLQGGTYTGYDAFDELEDHDAVFNGKGPSSERHSLAAIKRPGVEARLIKGYTDQTLEPDTAADFVFIDADHRTDAIWRDFRAVQNSRLICFDDVVFDGPENAGALPIMRHLETLDEWETAIVNFRVPFKPRGYTAIGFAWHFGAIEYETISMIEYYCEQANTEYLK